MVWSGRNFHDNDREYGVDMVAARDLRAWHPAGGREALALSEDDPIRRGFLTGLQGEIAKRGTIKVLRNGINAQRALDIGLFINGHGRHGGRTTRRLGLRGMERRQHGEVAIQGSTGRNVLPLCWTTGPIAVQSGRRRLLHWETG